MGWGYNTFKFAYRADGRTRRSIVPALQVPHDAPAYTAGRNGALLRKTKLDELPEVIKILRNEIGLVAPRPCLQVQTRLMEERMLRGILDLKPGISGLAQINNVDMSDPQHLAVWDARYAALRSHVLDVRIATATFAGGGRGDRTRPAH